MACFFIIPMEKQAINFPKIVHNAQSCGHFKFSWNDDTNDSKILALCTETCKFSLEATGRLCAGCEGS